MDERSRRSPMEPVRLLVNLGRGRACICTLPHPLARMGRASRSVPRAPLWALAQTRRIDLPRFDGESLEIRMNYEERDSLGMYKAQRSSSLGPRVRHGPGPQLMGADTLLGNEVFNGDDENLGSITEIMLDMESGAVRYAVLSFGGFMGLGEKLFAVPWSALSLDTARKRFVLDVNKSRLDNAPGFDKQLWPDMADPAWQKSIDDWYCSHVMPSARGPR